MDILRALYLEFLSLYIYVLGSGFGAQVAKLMTSGEKTKKSIKVSDVMKEIDKVSEPENEKTVEMVIPEKSKSQAVFVFENPEFTCKGLHFNISKSNLFDFAAILASRTSKGTDLDHVKLFSMVCEDLKAKRIHRGLHTLAHEVKSIIEQNEIKGK